MNQGSFKINCDILLTHIYELSKIGKLKACHAMTEYLSGILGKSKRQTYRYLKFLKDNKLIEVETSKMRVDDKSGKKYKKRKIRFSGQKHPKTENFVNIFFNKEFNKKQKIEFIRDLYKTWADFDKKVSTIEEPTHIVISPEPLEKVEIVEPKSKFVSLSKNIKKSFFGNVIVDDPEKEERERIEKIYEEEASKEKEAAIRQKYDEYVEDECAKIIKNIHDFSYVLKGENSYDKLKYLTLTENKKFGEYSDERLEIMAENSVVENGEYVITVYMGGKIPCNVFLTEYTGWDKSSEEYKRFKDKFEVIKK